MLTFALKRLLLLKLKTLELKCLYWKNIIKQKLLALKQFYFRYVLCTKKFKLHHFYFQCQWCFYCNDSTAALWQIVYWPPRVPLWTLWRIDTCWICKWSSTSRNHPCSTRKVTEKNKKNIFWNSEEWLQEKKKDCNQNCKVCYWN